jgi:copper chaperone NosL
MPPVKLRQLGTSLLILLTLLLTSGCEQEPERQQQLQRAVAIEPADECHLCGMIISNFPGPKGQLYEQGDRQTRKFCSTRELFAYLLDPEHRHRVQQVFVHNMAPTPWDQPADDAYIDARQAWYVAGSGLPGAMGPTLASFADQATAEAFIDSYGGRLYRFEQIDLALLSRMGL